ncbi:MAG: NAD(P)-binding domain-containing protein [Kofleriaceae bacterium]
MSRADTIGIVGAGRFGTALGSVLARANRRVILWSRDADVVHSIEVQQQSPRLPEAKLPPPLVATHDPRKLAAEARFIVMAVSSTNVRERSRELGDYLDGSHIVVHAVGAFAAPGHERVSEVIATGLPTMKIGALAGPALPADLVTGEFSSMVIASAFDEVVTEGRRLLNAPPHLRLYTSKDLPGVELASALAGAYTIALGLCDGLQVGVGPRAVLITRAVAEASRFGVVAGAKERTFAGLSGLGNLLVRATERSADYELGRRLAEGVVTADAQRTEGARAAIAGAQLAKEMKVRMPVLQGIAGILLGKLEPREVAGMVADTVAAEE